MKKKGQSDFRVSSFCPKTVGGYQTKVFEKLKMDAVVKLTWLAIRQVIIDP